MKENVIFVSLSFEHKKCSSTHILTNGINFILYDHIKPYYICIGHIFLFGGVVIVIDTGDWLQDLMHTRQVLYYWATFSAIYHIF